MATGYVVSGRGDLDALFKARTSAAAAAVGFLSNGGVDLSQRFEPRGGTAAIAATNFKSGATDLATIFMDIAAATTNYTMVVGTDGTANGYTRNAIDAPLGTWAPTVVWKPKYSIDRFLDVPSVNTFQLQLYNPLDGGIPANDDTAFVSISVTGVFTDSGGATVTKTRARSTVVNDTWGFSGGPSGTSPCRMYAFPQLRLIVGNTYTVGFI